MSGSRKLRGLAFLLGFLVAVGLMTMDFALGSLSVGGLSQDALSSLTTCATTGFAAFCGANAAEHYTKRVPSESP